MYLGLDGGGSKTAFVLLNNEGQVIAKYKTGGAYYLQIGLEGLSDIINEGVREIQTQSGVKPEDIKYTFLGLPAYGEDSRVKASLDVLPNKILGSNRYKCGNDMVCGWAGSLGCNDGINIVAGTGSIAYGEAGVRSCRAGGWGELIGDEGSAYWIAVKGLNLFSQMSDNRVARGPLYRIIKQHFKVEEDLDISGLIMSEFASQRDKIASLAKLVSKAANEGDILVAKIYEKAAYELAQLIKVVATDLPFDSHQPIKVSYSGGVFSSGSLILDPLKSTLENCIEKYVFVKPLYSPDVGAALYAAKLDGKKLTPSPLKA